MNSFEQIVNTVVGSPRRITVTWEKYSEWNKQWLFDAISGMRLGQSFCKYFGISNGSPLYHFKDNNISTQWIKDNYIEK